MAINTEVFKFNNEMNRRQNRDGYQASFPVIQALSKVGGSSGDADFRNAISDFSSAPVLYQQDAFGSADMYITKFHISISTSADMTPSDYGDISNGVTNGILVVFFQRGEFRIVSPAIKSNSDLQIVFNEVLDAPDLKFGAKLFTATLSLDTPLILLGGSTDFFAVQVNDDFSALVDHRFTISGWSTNLKEFQGD